jgi:DNA ligase-1
VKPFATLLDRLSYEPGRSAKVRLLSEYFEKSDDPHRGYALAAMTGTLRLKDAKPGLIRTLISERTDPALFEMAYDYVGDLAETVALMWPAAITSSPSPALGEIVEWMASAPKTELPAQIARWLDRLEETERWALLKLITGALRIGVSARLAKTALADMSAHAGRNIDVSAIEDIWHGLAPPYLSLFAWLEGRAPRPMISDPAPFRPVMLAQPIVESELTSLQPQEFVAEWKWDGIRLQATAGFDAVGGLLVRLFSRTGEDISAAFPDLVNNLRTGARLQFAIDGELLIVRDGTVQPFSVLQQRLNRKQVSNRIMAQYPAFIRAYDLLADNGDDLRALPFQQRRARLEQFIPTLNVDCIDVSAVIPFETWSEAAAARRDPIALGADAAAIEGLMLKSRSSPYVSGRPKGLWFKWKRDPFSVDAVLMYAQRGHGKRSSYYSDYTFGVWKGHEIVPVGKAYFGFTDEELIRIDRFVRNNTTNRFGPVREIRHGSDAGLVLEIAFDGLNRSSRHKSGIAMRFPRIARVRWDKPSRDADRIEDLERLIEDRRR